MRRRPHLARPSAQRAPERASFLGILIDREEASQDEARIIYAGLAVEALASCLRCDRLGRPHICLARLDPLFERINYGIPVSRHFAASSSIGRAAFIPTPMLT